jgi:hypothetical protein
VQAGNIAVAGTGIATNNVTIIRGNDSLLHKAHNIAALPDQMPVPIQ